MTPTKNESLPELPASFGDHCVTDSVRTMRESGYTANQMREYGRACYEAALTERQSEVEQLRLDIGHTQVLLAQRNDELEAALTREAPTEGVGGDRTVIGYDPGEHDREAEDYHVIMTMGRLLAAIALSVKGPEPAGTAWSYHDLPDIVAALQDAAEQVADEMTAWAATKMADRGSSRRDRLMISEWAKRLRNPEIFPVKDFEVEGTTLTKEEMRAIVRKVIASSPQVEAKRQTGEGE